MTAFDAHAHVIVPELLRTPSPTRHADLDAILDNRAAPGMLLAHEVRSPVRYGRS